MILPCNSHILSLCLTLPVIYKITLELDQALFWLWAWPCERYACVHGKPEKSKKEKYTSGHFSTLKYVTRNGISARLDISHTTQKFRFLSTKMSHFLIWHKAWIIDPVHTRACTRTRTHTLTQDL